MDLSVILIGVISVYFTLKIYVKSKGYLDVDILMNFKGLDEYEQSTSLKNIIDYAAEIGESRLLKDNVFCKVNVKNIGYQPVTIENCYITKIAFFPNHGKLILNTTAPKNREIIKDRIKLSLKGREFFELNRIVVEKYKKPEDFIDNKGILNVNLNVKNFTIGRLGKYSIDISEHFDDILFELEENTYGYFFLDIFCIDSLGRKWVLSKKSNKLLGKYSIGIGLNESFLQKI